MTRDGGTVIPILPQGQRAGRPGSRKSIETSGIEDAFHDLLHHSGLAVYLFDASANRLFINEAFRDIYNHLSDAPVKAVTDELPVPKHLADAVEEVRRSARRLVRSEQVVVGGAIRHFRAHHFPIFRGPNPVAVGGIYYDVTQQAAVLDQVRSSQTRLDDVIRSTSDWVWESDAEGRLTYVSERITEVLGRLPAALRGQSLSELGHFAPAPGGASDPFRAAAPFRNLTFEVRDLSGELRQIQISGVPVFSTETGRLTGFRGTGTDVTAQRRAEEHARQSRRDLETTLEELRNKNVQLEAALDQVLVASRAKGEFLAAMSHELRTPLNAIIGFAEVIMLNTFGDLPPKYRSYVAEIVNAGKHLLSKINDILDVAKAENKTLNLATEPTSAADIINRALAQVILRAQEKNIDISRVRLDRDYTLMVDPERARQILENLLSNAVKFTPSNGAVGIDVHKEAGDTLAITVWDTGIGIAEDKQDTIFESFQQIHDGIFSRSQGGTGLGLTVARHVANLMGGNITLESAPGRGSRFTVTLPLAKEQA
jgi:PAS domain S-box-containing protein